MTDNPDFVQGGMFGGLNFQPIDWNAPTGSQPANTQPQDWTTIPAIPQLPGKTFAPSATTQGPVITSSGGTSTGGSVSPNGSPINAQGTPSNASAATQPQPGQSIQSGSLADYFLRGVIIVLGFIFVAIGLNMFRPGVVPDPRHVLR